MRTPSKYQEKDLRNRFNSFLEKIFAAVKRIEKEGKTSHLVLADLAELERLALERRKTGKEVRVVVRPVSGPEQMERWVRESLATLGKGILLSEKAISSAMVLYNILENAQTPKELGNGLNEWVVG